MDCPNFKRHLLVIAAFSIFALPASAELKVHGFADVVGSTTSSDLTLQWLGNNAQEVNLDGASRLGLNLSADLGDHFEFAGQAVARGYAPVAGQPDYIIAADWLFFTYRPSDNWMIRAARQIYPLYLFSEQVDVGFTYLWTRLPQTVYAAVPVKSFNGISGAYSYTFGDTRTTLGIFAGTGLNEHVSAGIGGSSIHDEYVKGGYFSAGSDLFKLTATYKNSHPVGTIYAANSSGTQRDIPFDFGNNSCMAFGVSFNPGNWILLSEYSGCYSNLAGADNFNGYYGTVGYQFFGGRLTPHATFGQDWSKISIDTYPDPAIVEADPTGSLQTGLRQIVTGLNFRATNSIIMKLEYERDQLFYQNTIYNFGADTYTLAVDAVF